MTLISSKVQVQKLFHAYYVIDYKSKLKFIVIVRFTLNSSTRIIEFREFLNQFSTNFYEILHTLFSIHVVISLKISRSFSSK